MIYVFLANGFEEVEALTPVDYLRRCELPVQTVGVTGRTVTGSHGIPVTADILPEEMDLTRIDAVILPGGMPGTLNLEASEAVKDALNLVRGAAVPHCRHLRRAFGAGPYGTAHREKSHLLPGL